MTGLRQIVEWEPVTGKEMRYWFVRCACGLESSRKRSSAMALCVAAAEGFLRDGTCATCQAKEMWA